MSIPGSSLGLTAIEGIGLGALQYAAFIPQRVLAKPNDNSASIVAQVTIEEVQRDEMIITEHPVEQGATITDHAYKRPAFVTVRCGWSNSPSSKGGGLFDLPVSVLNGLTATFNVFNTTNTIQNIYDRMLALQASAVPFTLVTGKRTYQNMLFRSLTCHTDEKTENALMITAECQQIIIVTTQLTSVPSPKFQADPEKTGSTQNRGTLQALDGSSDFNADDPFSGDFDEFDE